MESQIEKILERLRRALEASEHTTSGFATLVGEDPKTVRAALSGRQALSLEQCFSWIAALKIHPGELFGLEDYEPELSGPRLVRAEVKSGGGLDPFGIPAEQAVQLGFTLGIDFLFVAQTAQLADSGVPGDVMATHPDSMVIKLDSAFHGHNAPRFSEEGVLLSLSFKGVNDCFFPWSSILQVIFHVGSPGDSKKTDDDPAPGPGLRLVE